MTYQDQFTEIVNKIDNTLNFNEVYESETAYQFKKKQGPCPFCGSGTHDSKSSDGAFTFYPSRNKAKCYSCGTATGIIKLITHTHNCTYKQAIHYISQYYLDTTLTDPKEDIQIAKFKQKKAIKISERKKASLEELKKEEEKKKKSYNYIRGLILAVEDKSLAVKYLQDRAINTGALEGKFYQANAYKNLPAGVVFFDTEKRCLNKRYITNELPEGVSKTFTFGEMLNSVYDETFMPHNDTVFITEGVINALSLFQCGKSAISLFATTNYISDVPKFKKYFNEKHVVLAFDFDKAGQQSTIKQANFIILNFVFKSLSVIIFPSENDANDLLQKKELENYINIKYNYAVLNKKLIAKELKLIQADQKNYFPKLRPDNYYNRPAVPDKEPNGKLIEKRGDITDQVLEMFYGSDFLCANTFQDFNIYYLEEYTIIEEKTAHIHTSTQENPIFLIHQSKNLQLIWRPFAGRPYNEFEYIGKKPENFNIGYSQIEKIYEANKKDTELITPELQKITIVYNLRDLLNLAAIDEAPLFFTGKELSYDLRKKLEGFAKIIYQVPTQKQADLYRAQKIGLKHIDICTMHVPKINGQSDNSISDWLKNNSSGLYKRQLNTALPFKFWEYEKGDYDISIIKLRNFLSALGYYTYENKQEKQSYMYIKIKGRIVENMDKNIFPRYIENIINNYLVARGETSKLRDKITTSSRFSERFLSGMNQIKLDFENSTKEFQNWFFDDGTMWTVTQEGIKHHSQRDLKKYVWEEDLLKYPSKVSGSPFRISYQKKYTKSRKVFHEAQKGTPEHFEAKKALSKFNAIDIYDIEITDRNNYFLQFLFFTSFVYWEEVERKGINMKPNDFWYSLEKILETSQINEIKLHLINKLTWLGYFMKDYKSMADDFGLAILDAIDHEPGLRKGGAAGGGKSIITKAIKEIKRTLIMKAEAEDFPENKHRYENYNGEKILVCDDMHLKSRIGNMLTDFSEGIEVNPKHKKPRKIPFIESPKIIITRNYIDDEGERVDRRLGRMFVFPFFHDNKGGRFTERRRPNDFFGRMLFQDDTLEDKSKLINLFATCYRANLQFAEINPPMMDMEKFRLIRRIGEPLVEYLDLLFDDEQNFGYIDRVPLFNNFKEDQRPSMNSYQRSNIYNTSQKFKALVEDYCTLRTLIINPKEFITDEKRIRIIRTSETQTNKSGYAKTTEHFYINTKEGFYEDLKTFEKTGITETKQPEQMKIPEPESNENGDLPF